MNNATTQSHIVWLDVIRTVAMLMVIGVHCIDPFYISPTLGSLPEYKHWAAVYGSLLRPSVPLFVMMTGLLLLPIREQSLGVFYKREYIGYYFLFDMVCIIQYIPLGYRAIRFAERDNR